MNGSSRISEVLVACALALLAAIFLFAQDQTDSPKTSSDHSYPNAGVSTVTVDGVIEPVFTVGRGTAPPQMTSMPPATYSKEAFENKIEGTVGLTIVVSTAGKVTHIRVTKSLGHGLDERAIEAVRGWKFKPGTREGKPVAVQIDIDLDFKLPDHR